MTLSQWWQIVALYEVILVWPLALVAFLALLRAKTRRGRVMGVSVLFVLFIPFIHRAIGDVYFDYLCEHKAGEFIYRTVDNVEGVLQMRPRDGSKDYFDRMAMGDIPEDPWGHTNAEARAPWTFIGSYAFFETLDTAVPRRISASSLFHHSMKLEPSVSDRVARFYGYNGKELRTFRKEFDARPRSQYGFTWREVSGAVDRIFNVHQGEVSIMSLADSETLAVKRGFYRTRPRQICPVGKHDWFVLDFIVAVLKPTDRSKE